MKARPALTKAGGRRPRRPEAGAERPQRPEAGAERPRRPEAGAERPDFLCYKNHPGPSLSQSKKLREMLI